MLPKLQQNPNKFCKNSSYGVDFNRHLKKPPESSACEATTWEVCMCTGHSYKLSGLAMLIIRRPMRRAWATV